jgi:hypothetical protein
MSLKKVYEMGKQLKNDDEMEKIVQHLDRQDKTLNEILIVLRGSVALGVDGIVEKQADFEERLVKLINEVAHYERWRQRIIAERGKITFSLSSAVKNAFAFIGALGALIGGLLALKQWLEQ